MSAVSTDNPNLEFKEQSALDKWLSSLNRNRTTRMIVAITLLVLLLSTVRVIAADNLTSSDMIGLTIRRGVPILLAGLAALWSERVGIVNIGIEGMMIFGTWFGAWGAWKFGPWQGLALGIIGGMVAAMIHALATVRFNVNHVISGLAVNLLAVGGMRYLSELVYTKDTGGGISQSPAQKAAIQTFSAPILAGGKIFGWKSPDMLGWFEEKSWFLISDAAGMLRGVVYQQSWATIVALLLVPTVSFVLWRTRFGLRARSSGEDPFAAESLGVKVARLRYGGLALSGAFAGMGGAYLSIVLSSYYRQGQTAQRGYIGIATVIFGNWMPGGVFGGAMLFGFSDAVSLRGGDNLMALFLIFCFVAALLFLVSAYRQRIVGAASSLIVALGLGILYLRVDEVPESLTQATPYVVTLVVLAAASQQLRPPAYAGLPFRPGESH